MNISPKAPLYRMYLLTLWAEQGQYAEAPVVWRFSLKDPHTGQQHGYVSLTTLVAALVEQLAKIEEAQLKGGDEGQVQAFY